MNMKGSAILKTCTPIACDNAVRCAAGFAGFPAAKDLA
jgi:hypothetical protein